MKMTSDGNEPQDLKRRILVELLALRRRPSGLTVETIVEAETVCALLGAGDPFVAYTRLRHEVLESDLQLSIRAAAASLALTSDATSHLERMDEFGAAVHLEQRQVRRYSDRGVRAIAGLIASNWTVQNVPQLTALVARRAEQGWSLNVSTRRLLAVEIRQPRIEILSADESYVPAVKWTHRDAMSWQVSQMTQTIVVSDRPEETSVMIVWRGELWPKWDVHWRVGSDAVSSESLGNRLALRLKSPSGADPDKSP